MERVVVTERGALEAAYDVTVLAIGVKVAPAVMALVHSLPVAKAVLYAWVEPSCISAVKLLSGLAQLITPRPDRVILGATWRLEYLQLS